MVVLRDMAFSHSLPFLLTVTRPTKILGHLANWNWNSFAKPWDRRTDSQWYL